MKKILFSVAFCILAVATQAQIPAGYYNAATGLEGYQLKTALYNIIKNHNDQGYGALYDAYEEGYDDNGTVLDMYSENPDGNDLKQYAHHQETCGNYSNEGDCYNREHLFPQSLFNEDYPMRSDYHHVVPSDGKVNGQRSNLAFGEVGSASWTSLNGSKKGTSSSPGYSGTVFEPIDEYKGDIARGLLYFGTRYETQVDSWSHSMTNGTEDQVFSDWFLEVLLKWHNQDPVSPKEIIQNNAGYDHQGNRNPFIDHPEYVNCIWATCSGLQFTSMPITNATESTEYTYDITYNVDIDSETISCTTKPAWLTFTKNEASDMAQLNGTPSFGDIGNHSVVLELTEDGVTETQSFTILVSEWTSNTDVLNLSACSTDWEIVSDASNKDWECFENNYYEVNGYDATNDTPSQDWLISPSIDLDVYENEVFSFDSWTQWNDSGIERPEIKFKYSTDYDGQGNPSSASWFELSYSYPAEDSQNWTSSGDIDISAIDGTNVHFAFYYTSTGGAPGDAAYWKIDNVVLNADHVVGVEELNSIVDIYPNPASSFLNIRNVAAFSNITILNAVGQVVLSQKNNANLISVNTENYNSGLYFIRLQTETGETIIKKFIKEVK